MSCGRASLGKSGLQNGPFSGIDFDAIRAPKWAPLGPHLAPFWRPSGAKRRPRHASKADQMQKRRFSRNLAFSNVFFVFSTPRRRPKRPRIAPRRLQDALLEPSERSSASIDFLTRLRSRFGTFLAPKRAPQNGPFFYKIGPRSLQESFKLGNCNHPISGTRFGCVLGASGVPFGAFGGSF